MAWISVSFPFFSRSHVFLSQYCFVLLPGAFGEEKKVERSGANEFSGRKKTDSKSA